MHTELSPRWQPGPAAPRLRADQIDIWWIDLAGQHPPERPPNPGTTAAVVRSATHVARVDILGRYLGMPAEALEFGVHPGGKPFLRHPARTLEFNQSHSSGAALVAVATGLAVGIDIEAQRTVRDPLRLARRALPGKETELLAALRPEARGHRFLDLWTQMEARQKAVGRGIFRQAVDPSQVSVFSFRPGADLFAALAVSPARADVSVRFLRYSRS